MLRHGPLTRGPWLWYPVISSIWGVFGPHNVILSRHYIAYSTISYFKMFENVYTLVMYSNKHILGTWHSGNMLQKNWSLPNIEHVTIESIYTLVM